MIQAIIICSVYLALLISVTKYFGIKYTEIAQNTNNILKGIIYPVGICTVLLTVFAYSTGWLPKVFTYSPRITSPWLWAIPLVLLFGILVRLSYLQSSHLDRKALGLLLLGTFFVGFSEELLVRGIAVGLLQRANLSVLLVGIISSLIFGLLHFANLSLGQDIRKTGAQVAITTLMGINFYVIYVISGTLWLPIVLHALYDFSLLLMDPKYSDKNNLRTGFLISNILILNILPLAALLALA